jgi:transcriptional regulator of acetoin/glycerol metabolism
MAEGEDEIGVEHLPEDFLQDCDAAPCDDPVQADAAPPGNAPAAPSRMQEVQTTLIEQTLTRHGGNVSATARELGLARNTIYRYLRQRRPAH